MGEAHDIAKDFVLMALANQHKLLSNRTVHAARLGLL